MTFDDFLIFLEKNKGLLLGTQTATQKQYQKIVNQIRPHIEGTLPDAIKAAFPNEGGEVLEYRKNVYKAKTKALFSQAVLDLSRAFSGNKFAVHFENSNFEEFLKSYKIKGVNIYAYILGEVYWRRVADPNAVLLVTAYAGNDQQVAQPKPQIIASNRIVFESDTVFIYKASAKEQKAGISHQIVTTEFYGTISRQNNEQVVNLTYPHKLGYLPLTKLGGKPIILTNGGYLSNTATSIDYIDEDATIYESDFSAAIPYLDGAAQYDSQFDAVMFTSAFPTTIVQGIVCETCNGMRHLPCAVEEHESGQKTCTGCNGAGHIQRSPLKAVMVATREGMTADERIANAQVKPIEFVEPSVASATLLKETRNEDLEQARQILNVHQGIKQAQSGVAKEFDRESVYNQIATISEYMFNILLLNTLVAMQDLLFIDKAKRGTITVNAPTSFGLQTQQQSITELKDSLTGLPNDLRHKAYFDYIQKYYYGDPTATRIAQFCTEYAALYLHTEEEKTNGIAAGFFTQDDILKSNFVHFWLLQIAVSTNIATADFATEIKPKLDALFLVSKPIVLPPPKL